MERFIKIINMSKITKHIYTTILLIYEGLKLFPKLKHTYEN